MSNFFVGIGLGEKERNATHMAFDGGIREGFTFFMNANGYIEFRIKIPLETRIAFEASGSAYSVSRAQKDLGYNDVKVAHPKELSWIIKSKKNEMADSVKLVKLHLAGMLPEIQATAEYLYVCILNDSLKYQRSSYCRYRTAPKQSPTARMLFLQVSKTSGEINTLNSEGETQEICDYLLGSPVFKTGEIDAELDADIKRKDLSI